MLPTKWSYEFDKPTESISWLNTDYTFQSTVSFPTPRHNYLPYFENFITSMTGTVAIGLGTANIKGEKLLPGWKQGSFGYHADDGKVFLEDGVGKDYGPTYNVGDVIGCGITLKNELYFTKNGKHLGVTCVLPKGKYFPVVGLDKASISTNFGDSAFLYDPFRPSVSSNQGQGTAIDFKNVNETTMLHILSFLDIQSLARFAQTSRGNCRVAKDNQIWKALVNRKWANVSTAVPISNYYRFYKARNAGISASGVKNPILIENCFKWDFQCPVALNKISRTADPKVDFCSVCKKNVYLVHDPEQLKERVNQGHCVALDFSQKEINSRSRPPPPRMMGRMVRPVHPTPLLSKK